jgi:hypothetical protein
VVDPFVDFGTTAVALVMTDSSAAMPTPRPCG